MRVVRLGRSNATATTAETRLLLPAIPVCAITGVLLGTALRHGSTAGSESDCCLLTSPLQRYGDIPPAREQGMLTHSGITTYRTTGCHYLPVYLDVWRVLFRRQ